MIWSFNTHYPPQLHPGFLFCFLFFSIPSLARRRFLAWGNFLYDFAQGDPQTKWEAQFNINIGCYF